MRKKVVIWGTGQVGVSSLGHISLEDDVIAFIDNDTRRQTDDIGGGGVSYNDKTYPVYAPEKLKELDFDKIYICAFLENYIVEIANSLKILGIDESKIDFSSFGKVCKFARLNFIHALAMQFKAKNTQGNVAEFGVWRGETARYINHYFKNDGFYLFDTFEGFSEKDIEKEKQIGGEITAKSSDFSDTSLDFVKAQMPYLDKCHFIKGYFPQSTEQITAEPVFKFVNIDVDLYQPILAGLEWFYPRLVKGGVLLVHDYFHHFYTGVEKAVNEFASQNNLKFYPIGDAFSVFFVKD